MFAAELAEEQGYGPLVEGDDGTRWNVIVRRWARKIARWKNDGVGKLEIEVKGLRPFTDLDPCETPTGLLFPKVEKEGGNYNNGYS